MAQKRRLFPPSSNETSGFRKIRCCWCNAEIQSDHMRHHLNRNETCMNLRASLYGGIPPELAADEVGGFACSFILSNMLIRFPFTTC